MTEIRYIGRDAPLPRHESKESEAAAGPPSEDRDPLIRSVAGAALQEIELVILELQRVRDIVQAESGRLSREIARYAGFNRSLMASMKVIRESLEPMGSPNGRAQP